MIRENLRLTSQSSARPEDDGAKYLSRSQREQRLVSSSLHAGVN